MQRVRFQTMSYIARCNTGGSGVTRHWGGSRHGGGRGGMHGGARGGGRGGGRGGRRGIGRRGAGHVGWGQDYQDQGNYGFRAYVQSRLDMQDKKLAAQESRLSYVEDAINEDRRSVAQ